MATELTGAVQPAPQNTPASPVISANVGVSGNINKTPDTLVTQTAKADKPDVHEDGAHDQQARELNRQKLQSQGIPRLEEMSGTGVKTVVGFDIDETNHIYIRVQDIKTGHEIAQIPSKEFIHYLRRRFQELSGSQELKSGVSTSI